MASNNDNNDNANNNNRFNTPGYIHLSRLGQQDTLREHRRPDLPEPAPTQSGAVQPDPNHGNPVQVVQGPASLKGTIGYEALPKFQRVPQYANPFQPLTFRLPDKVPTRALRAASGNRIIDKAVDQKHSLQSPKPASQTSRVAPGERLVAHRVNRQHPFLAQQPEAQVAPGSNGADSDVQSAQSTEPSQTHFTDAFWDPTDPTDATSLSSPYNNTESMYQDLLNTLRPLPEPQEPPVWIESSEGGDARWTDGDQWRNALLTVEQAFDRFVNPDAFEDGDEEL